MTFESWLKRALRKHLRKYSSTLEEAVGDAEEVFFHFLLKYS